MEWHPAVYLADLQRGWPDKTSVSESETNSFCSMNLSFKILTIVMTVRTFTASAVLCCTRTASLSSIESANSSYTSQALYVRILGVLASRRKSSQSLVKWLSLAKSSLSWPNICLIFTRVRLAAWLTFVEAPLSTKYAISPELKSSHASMVADSLPVNSFSSLIVRIVHS